MTNAKAFFLNPPLGPLIARRALPQFKNFAKPFVVSSLPALLGRPSMATETKATCACVSHDDYDPERDI